ncbi:MAG: TIGR02266 family protein [Myxococcota bacterium]
MSKPMIRGDTAPDLNERRKSDRADLVVRVNYRTVDELFSEFARNINEGGIFIETENPHALGSSVALEFKLPEHEAPIEVVGIVVRISDGSRNGEPPGMGIEFGDLNAAARQQINDLVRQLRSDGRPG